MFARSIAANHLQANGPSRSYAILEGRDDIGGTWVDFSSGYFQRAPGQLPKQVSRMPWKLNQNYLRDLVAMRFASVEDGAMEFSR